MNTSSTGHYAQILGEQNSYRTPFWSDHFDWSSDQVANQAATAALFAGSVTSKRKRLTILFCLVYLAVEVLLLVAWLSSTDANNNGGDQYGVPFGILLVAFLPIALAINAWSNAPWKYFNSLAQVIHSQSWNRYEVWKMSLNATNPNLLFQVLNWEQNQALLVHQQRAAVAAEEAARLARETADYARKTAQNTSAIRSELDDPRWGQFGPRDYPQR